MRADAGARPRDWIAEERAAVVAEALSWIGTPFHHAAALKGVGVDCAQFLIETYAVIGMGRPAVGPYSPDWFLHGEEDLDRYVRWVQRYGAPVDTPATGDVALFRYGNAVSHAAIVVGEDVVVHAFRELGVILGSLAPTHDLYPRFAGYWRLRRWMTPDSGGSR